MEVKINKEIREYTEGIFLGLSLRQCLFSFLACVMAVIFYFLFIDCLGMEITSWLCMISAAPFAALGFIRFQGMNAEQIVVCAIRSLLIKQHNLIFKPQNLYYEYLKENNLEVEFKKLHFLEKDNAVEELNKLSNPRRNYLIPLLQIDSKGV